MNSKKMFNVIPVIVFAVIITSYGGGGASSSGSICNPVDSLQNSPGASGLISWPFVNPRDYIYDAAKILISDGTARLISMDQTDGCSETNSASQISVYLWAFHTQVGTGTVYFKAFLHSDTNQQVELGRVYLSYAD